MTDAFPIPCIEELMDRMAWGNFPTTADLCKEYWQIALDMEDIPKSAFITPFNLYPSRVMSFGMKNSPATFQRMVDCLLDGLQDFVCLSGRYHHFTAVAGRIITIWIRCLTVSDKQG